MNQSLLKLRKETNSLQKSVLYAKEGGVIDLITIGYIKYRICELIREVVPPWEDEKIFSVNYGTNIFISKMQFCADNRDKAFFVRKIHLFFEPPITANIEIINDSTSISGKEIVFKDTYVAKKYLIGKKQETVYGPLHSLNNEMENGIYFIKDFEEIENENFNEVDIKKWNFFIIDENFKVMKPNRF